MVDGVLDQIPDDVVQLGGIGADRFCARLDARRDVMAATLDDRSEIGLHVVEERRYRAFGEVERLLPGVKARESQQIPDESFHPRRVALDDVQELSRRPVAGRLVEMGAALIEGAPGTTQDLDLWFGSIDPERIREAASRAGGFYTAGFGLQPPAIGGDGLDRIDIVLNAEGLGSFDEEYARSHPYDLEDVRVRVLPLERVIASKRASKRAKDLAQLPQLEATLAAKRAAARGE